MTETHLNRFREDPDSATAWSGGVRVRVGSDVPFGASLGQDSGESFRVAFEGPTVPPHTRARQG